MQNSAYGCCLTDRTRYTSVKYASGDLEIRRLTNSSKFKSKKRLADTDIHEVVMGHKVIAMDLPIQIGVTILMEAKLHMLNWYYSFLRVFIDQRYFSSILTDTDSWYGCFAGETLEDCVRPELKEEFDRRIYDCCGNRDEQAFLPRKCCLNDKMEDSKFPGLFKQEAACLEIVSLCSKTYVCRLVDSGVKLSAKGVNIKNVIQNNPLEKFKRVLKTGVKEASVNVGFVEKGGHMFTYKSIRDAFPWLYVKRQVKKGGKRTQTIDVVLRPVPRDFLILQVDLEVLAPDFVLEFSMELDFTPQGKDSDLEKVERHRCMTIHQALCLVKHLYCKHLVEVEETNKATEVTQIKICETTKPKIINRYIQEMGNVKIYDKFKPHIIKEIVTKRMRQYPALNEILMSSVGYHLVNACPFDYEWGNGANAKVTRWRPNAAHQGENMLGMTYMMMRIQKANANHH